MKSIKKAARRAFSLVEMVIVLVVAGLLAAIAVAGFSSVVDRAEEQTATQSLRNIEAEYRAMDAFNAPNFGEGVASTDMTALPSNIEFENVDEDVDGDYNEGDKLVTTLGDGSTIELTLGNAHTAGYISSGSGAGTGSGDTGVTVPVVDPVASAFNVGLTFDGTFLQPSLETPSLDALGAGVTGFEVQCRVVENGETNTDGAFKTFGADPSTTYDEPEDFVYYYFYLWVRNNWGYKTEGTGIACAPSNSGSNYFMADVESGDRIEIEWQARTFNGVEWSDWSTTFGSGEVLIP